MSRKSNFNVRRLDQVLREQYFVISRRQALLGGMSPKSIEVRARPGGPWQRVLPGVYVAQTGTLTQDQRAMAALLHGGPKSMITGATAVRLHHLRSAGPDAVDVLIPSGRRRQSVGFVRVHRTTRMPDRLFTTGRIRFTKPARAVADAARSMACFDDVRAVVCEAVQRKACTVPDLAAELRSGPTAGSALLREALAEISDGVRSVAEGDFRQLLLRSGLPVPVFNAQLVDADGNLIAITDAWWQAAGVAAEVDSRAYHLAAQDQDHTTGRHDKLVAHGILLLHFPPTRMKTDPAGIISEISQAIKQGRRRPPLAIKVLPPEADPKAEAKAKAKAEQTEAEAEASRSQEPKPRPRQRQRSA